MDNSFSKQTYPWKTTVDYRVQPEKYQVGKGEQGVLLCEPYKSEILPYWRFKTPELALASSEKIYQLFLAYLKQNDFVGADLARKFLQMGFTRARRYANYAGGKKYAPGSAQTLKKGTGDPQKVISASTFYKKWRLAEQHQTYKMMKTAWKKRYG